MAENTSAETTVVFKNGNLVRLLLKDFMTYKKVELKAGPNLNLVLGPNGTGKSALVCAIIIGLGGDPSTTGRSGHLGEYIRFGCDKALLEIELYNESLNDKNFLIQRVIHSKVSAGKTEYSSSYKLNGKDSNRTNVRDFVRTLNINVDNLCQFLPQERVIEFVKMDRKTLLECTEKAAGNEDMFESHQQIVVLTKSLKKLNEIETNLSNQISTETELQVRAEEELRRIEERDRFKDEIKWLKKKLPWIEYEDKRVEYVTAKEQVMQKKQEIQKLSKCLDPLKAEVNSSRKALTECQAIKTKALNELQKSAKNIEPIKSKIEDIFDKIKDTKSDYFSQLETENNRKSRIRQLESDLTVLREQFDNINEDNTDVEQQIKDVLKELNEVNAESTHLSQTNMKFKGENEKLVFERNHCESKRKALEDVFRKRLERLQTLSPNAAKAYEWLRLNENRFKCTIHPPIMTQINLNRIEWSKYVENAIPKNDLQAFVCEDSDDLKLFTESLKQELNIRVNVVLAPKQSAQDFEPDFEMNGFKNYGLFTTVKDMFKAPDKVMAYLCKNQRLHSIPVGDQTTDQNIENLIKNSNFRRIYSNKSIYNIVVSRYDRQKVTASDTVPEARYLNLTVDEKQLKEVKQKISSLEERIAEVKQQSTEVDLKLVDLNTKSCDLKDKKKLLDNKKNEKRILETKINEKREQISRYEKQTINLEEIKQKTDQTLNKLEENQMNLLTNLTKSIGECIQTNDRKLKSVLNEFLFRKRQQIGERKLAFASNQFQDLTNELQRLESSLKVLKREAKDLKETAEEVSGFDVNKCETEIRDKFDSLPNSVDEINNEIETLKLRMNSILDADESVRESYNQRKNNIEKRRKDLETKRAEMTQKQTKLEELKNRWLPELEELIAKINTNFGNFMARLNCAGDVSLFKPNESDSFDEFGISIKVKFRQTEQLRELTSFHQSGGERSVSTMIYMIALQELTHVPFRCVDEINQGMDENNERSVFDLISETSIRNNSQYFLFSPKLLNDLTYTQEMTIHIIFNGPYMEFDWSRVQTYLEESDEE